MNMSSGDPARSNQIEYRAQAHRPDFPTKPP